MHKLLAILMISVVVTGCDLEKYPNKHCTSVQDPKKEEQLYLHCLDNLRDMRKGNDYTTNDDEDLDSAISSCQSQAKHVSDTYRCKYVYSKEDKDNWLKTIHTGEYK